MVTRSSAVLLSVAAALFLVCRHKVNGNCPVYGCSPSHSFTTETAIFSFTPNFKPQLQWRFEHDELMPTGAGCVTNAARVVCPMRRNNGYIINIIMQFLPQSNLFTFAGIIVIVAKTVVYSFFYIIIAPLHWCRGTQSMMETRPGVPH